MAIGESFDSRRPSNGETGGRSFSASIPEGTPPPLRKVVSPDTRGTGGISHAARRVVPLPSPDRGYTRKHTIPAEISGSDITVPVIPTTDTSPPDPKPRYVQERELGHTVTSVRKDAQAVARGVVRGVDPENEMGAAERTKLFNDEWKKIARQNDGFVQARDTLAAGRSDAAQFTAHTHAFDPDTRPDLEQAASLGVLQAAENFDPERSQNFFMLASLSAQSEVNSVIRGQHPIHVPQHVFPERKQVHTVNDVLTQELQREPTAQEIAERMHEGSDTDIDPERVRLLLHSPVFDRHLIPIGTSDVTEGYPVVDEETLPDQGRPVEDHALDQVELQGLIDNAGLTETEAYVLFQRYGEDRENGDIGQELFYTPQSISLISHVALAKIRNAAGIRPDEESSRKGQPASSAVLQRRAEYLQQMRELLDPEDPKPNVKELAEQLGVSLRTAYNYLNEIRRDQ